MLKKLQGMAKTKSYIHSIYSRRQNREIEEKETFFSIQ